MDSRIEEWYSELPQERLYAVIEHLAYRGINPFLHIDQGVSVKRHIARSQNGICRSLKTAPKKSSSPSAFDRKILLEYPKPDQRKGGRSKRDGSRP